MKKRLMILTGIFLIGSISVAYADSHYLLIVTKSPGITLERLSGFPGRAWGKTTDKVYLFGGENEIAWLENRQIEFTSVLFDQEPSPLYLNYFDNPSLPANSQNILDAGINYLLSTVPLEGAEAVRRMPLRKLPLGSHVPQPAGILTYHPTIDSLVGEVSQDTIMDFLNKLSGEAGIEVEGEVDTIHTRFSGTEGNELAASYLKGILENYGYQTEYHAFFSGALRNVAAYGEDRGWVVDENGKAYRTLDAGANWDLMNPNVTTSLWGVANAGLDSVWLSGNLGTIRFSSDGGDNFVTQTAGLSVYLFGCCFINSQSGWIACDNGYILRTTNAGQDWATQDPPTNSRFYDVYFVDSDYGWAVGRDGVIVHTTNGGTNWAQQTSGTLQRLYGVYFLDRTNGWAVGWGGVILQTNNGGSLWNIVSVGETNEKYQIDFADSQRGCLVGWSGKIYYTTDGGANWEPAEANTLKDFYGVCLQADLTGFAVGDGVLAKTTNGGQSWDSQTGNIEGAWQNVIAAKTGTVNPDEQVIICGHFDDTSEQPQTRAPGADDNGSGTAAVVEAARLFALTNFEKTIKFCLWTGEEQGLHGSAAYAADAYSRGDDIIGVFNFDMIAWDGNADNNGELHCGTEDASIALGDIMQETITDYGINLDTDLLTWGSTDRSDHASFWDYDYPAMLGIEDFSSDFNPYYHSTQDNMTHIMADYFTEYVKAAVGTAASLAIPDTAGVGIAENKNPPQDFALLRNYPNPFNATTIIALYLPAKSSVELVIYNLIGERVATLYQGVLQAGRHNITWQADDFASGVYLYRLAADGQIETGKMVLLK